MIYFYTDLPGIDIIRTNVAPKETSLSSQPSASSSLECRDCPRHPLSGKVLQEQKDPFQIFAVIIDNHTQASIPYGLARAELVYETEVEGGITRYLAFFTSEDNIERIGPVRSARPYFLDWAESFSALMVHCGGSPQALSEIAGSRIPNLDEFYQADHFWRSNELTAPHNIFTSSSLIKKYLEDENIPISNIEINEERFYNEIKEMRAQGETSTRIKIPYQPPHYEVRWEYNREEGDYIRYLAGERHTDGSGDIIRANNVIIQSVPTMVKDEE